MKPQRQRLKNANKPNRLGLWGLTAPQFTKHTFNLFILRCRRHHKDRQNKMKKTEKTVAEYNQNADYPVLTWANDPEFNVVTWAKNAG